MVDALNARDWRTLEAMLDERTVVADHRELPFEGTGATMLRVWRSVFEEAPTGRAELDVLEDAGDRAVVRLRMGDEEGRLQIRAVVEVADGHVARFEAFPAG